MQFAVHQLKLEDMVTFTGKLSPKEVKEKLSVTDIYIQYSLQEGFCNAVLEAQAMGLFPGVVSDAEGLSENVLNITGFVVPKNKMLPCYMKN
ncbi:glycosyltransferase family 4 protein [Flavobacterium sp.]|uniref:glycosyltransferase family 4 protein n=1 Tax=Flavobacterium sp. TaxID=239 RepID=UPI003528F8C9